MPEIKNLTNKAGTVVYPKTSSDAVDVNGTILTNKITELEAKVVTYESSIADLISRIENLEKNIPSSNTDM